MYYGLTFRCSGLDGRVNFLIAVVAYLADVRRTISVTCHSKKLLSSCRQSGAAVSQTRFAVPTFFISKTNIRLMPSHFVPYAGVVPPLTPTLFHRLRRTSQKAFRFSANSHARAAKRQFRAAYSITPHQDFSLSESVSPACGHIPSLSFLNRSCACEKA